MVEVQHPFLKVVVPNDYKGVTFPPEVVCVGEVVWLDEGVKEGEIGGLSGDYCFIQSGGGGWVF